MSITYPSLDQATASVLRHIRQPLDEGSGQQPGAVSSYVGVHRRRDGQAGVQTTRRAVQAIVPCTGAVVTVPEPRIRAVSARAAKPKADWHPRRQS